MLRSLLRIGFWTAAAFAFVMAILPQPPTLPTPDKVQHMLAFFTLAVLGSAAYPRISPAWFGGLLCAFGGLIELIQTIPALNRDGDLLDWMADILAAAVGLFVVHAWRRFRSSRQPAIGDLRPERTPDA